MYLHIGNGITVRKKNVIGIFDLDSATVSAVTKKYINKNEKEAENINKNENDLQFFKNMYNNYTNKNILSL